MGKVFSFLAVASVSAAVFSTGMLIGSGSVELPENRTAEYAEKLIDEVVASSMERQGRAPKDEDRASGMLSGRVASAQHAASSSPSALYEELLVEANWACKDPGTQDHKSWNRTAQAFNMVQQSKKGDDLFPEAVFTVGEDNNWCATHQFLDALSPFEA